MSSNGSTAIQPSAKPLPSPEASLRFRDSVPSALGTSSLSPPPVLIQAAEAFCTFFDADVVWLAVRESRARSAVIRYVEGAHDRQGLGLRIKPGLGVGGTVLL